MSCFFVYPARHYVIPENRLKAAVESIKAELNERLQGSGMIEAHRLPAEQCMTWR